jgi:hypothetical protein
MFVVVVVFVCAMPVANGAIVLRVLIFVHSRKVAFLSVTVDRNKVRVYFYSSILARGAQVLSWPLRSCHRETVNCIFTWELLI